MKVIEARNVNCALFDGARYLRRYGIERPSRNGPVLVAPTPVTTVYEEPTERVLFHEGRDANPFFHLIEALWMLAGRNDLKTLTAFVQNMANFSDDGGKTQPGAYGYRWRNHFQMDQLVWAVNRLKNDPNDRRVVIQMYDADVDQEAADSGGKDIPCNLIALPTVSVDNRLDLTVYNRSNDMIWGAYGANAVHFSVLQEFIANMLGLPVGRYYQVSNNFHAYLSTFDKAPKTWPWYNDESEDRNGDHDPYEAGIVQAMDMFPGMTVEEVYGDLSMFFKDPARIGIRSEFLRKIACPMIMAHRAYKRWGGADGIASAREILEQMPADNDWKLGAVIWLNNREARLNRAKDDGVNYEAQNGNGTAPG